MRASGMVVLTDPKKKRCLVSGVTDPVKTGIGRGERIRTSGPYVPNVVLYQAELLPGGGGYTRSARPLQHGGAPAVGQLDGAFARA